MRRKSVAPGPFALILLVIILLLHNLKQLAVEQFGIRLSLSAPTDKWLITTRHLAIEEIQTYVAAEWNIVYLAKSPHEWEKDFPTFYRLHNLKGATEGLANMTSANIARIAGLVFAYRMGAQYIYDDVGGILPGADDLEAFDTKKEISGLRYHGENGPIIFNPYAHFTSRHIKLPRGMNHTHREGSYRLCRTMTTPPVQYAVDTRHRFAPTVTVANGIYTPLVSIGALYSRPYFFAAIAGAFNTTLGQFYIQTILREAGVSYSLVPIRNEVDPVEESENAAKMRKFLNFVDSWTCKHTLRTCMEELAEALHEQSLWSEDDVNTVQMWIKVLKSEGVHMPKKKKAEVYDIGEESDRLKNCRRAHLDLRKRLPWNAKRPARKRAAQLSRDFTELQEWCTEPGPNNASDWTFPSKKAVAKRTRQSRILSANLNTVAILTNNFAWGANVGILQRMYETSFGMLIFCGEFPTRMESLVDSSESLDFPSPRLPVSYVHLSHEELNGGYQIQVCLAKVAEMRLRNVTGYFMFADDTVFNVWRDLDLDIVHLGPHFDLDDNYWWGTPHGQSAMRNTRAIVRRQYWRDPRTAHLMNTMRFGYGMKHRNVAWHPLVEMSINDRWLASDWLYVPTAQLSLVQFFAQITYEAGLFHEMFWDRLSRFIPAYIHERDSTKTITYLWWEERQDWFGNYSSEGVGLHPVKHSYLRDRTNRSLFCDGPLTAFHQNLFSPGKLHPVIEADQRL